MNKRLHSQKKADSSASNPVRSQFQSRPFIAQAKAKSEKPLTQPETENREFQQQKFEATKLKLQAKNGTITPEGQERLTVLQAKMSGTLQRRLENASSKGSNLANIPISRPDAPSQQVVQTKLTIGEPGDKYEQEADRVAEQVVKQIHAPVSQQEGQNLQRADKSVEEKELQMKPMLQLRSAKVGMTAVPDLEASIKQARGGGQSLANNIRKPMEQAFGADFSGVKVHTDAQSDQLNRSIQARAFTTGQDVFFRHGEYNPGSRGGQELLAHELTHVVQQSPESQQSASPSKNSIRRKGDKIFRSISSSQLQRAIIQRAIDTQKVEEYKQMLGLENVKIIEIPNRKEITYDTKLGDYPANCLYSVTEDESAKSLFEINLGTRAEQIRKDDPEYAQAKAYDIMMSQGGASYAHTDNMLFYNEGNDEKNRSIFHEMGHAKQNLGGTNFATANQILIEYHNVLINENEYVKTKEGKEEKERTAYNPDNARATSKSKNKTWEDMESDATDEENPQATQNKKLVEEILAILDTKEEYKTKKDEIRKNLVNEYFNNK